MKDSTLVAMHAWLYGAVTVMIMPMILIEPTGFGYFTGAVMASATIVHGNAAHWLTRAGR